MDVFGLDESGFNRRVTEVGDSMSTWWQQHAGIGGVVCAVKRNLGRKEFLKHPTETNTAVQYGLFRCIYHEATKNSTYKATLKCNRIGYVDNVPLPQPSPQSQQSTISRLWILLNCYSCFSHPEHSIFKWRFYTPYTLYIKITWICF